MAKLGERRTVQVPERCERCGGKMERIDEWMGRKEGWRAVFARCVRCECWLKFGA